MRKSILGALLALSIGSCTTNEIYITPLTSVSAKITTPTITGLTGKNVERGAIPVWVKKITLTSTCTTFTHTSNTIFDLVADGTSGAANTFIIDDVAIGNNNFTAVSTTDVVSLAEEGQYVNPFRSGISSTDQINILKKRNPYAVYVSPVVNKSITAGVINTINIPMTTNNGRMISIFKLDELLHTQNYHAVIVATFDGQSITSKSVDNTNDIYMYWSGEKCLAGKKISYDVKVYDVNDVLVKSYVVNDVKASDDTSPVTTVFKASTSIQVVYTINRDGISESINEATFSFQPWIDENHL